MVFWLVKAFLVVVVIWLALKAIFRGAHLAESSNKFGTPSSAAFAVAATLQIAYCDFNGVKTKRTVRVTQYDPLQRWVIGQCSLRKARRTFRAERILTAVDMETGEIVSDLPSFFYEREPRRICRDKILSDWVIDPSRWRSAAAASRHYALMPGNKDYPPETIARWIRDFDKKNARGRAEPIASKE